MRWSWIMAELSNDWKTDERGSHSHSARTELQKIYQLTTTDTAAGARVWHSLNRMRNAHTVHNNGDAVRSDTTHPLWPAGIIL
jgi:hypothetical protein